MVKVTRDKRSTLDWGNVQFNKCPVQRRSAGSSCATGLSGQQSRCHEAHHRPSEAGIRTGPCRALHFASKAEVKSRNKIRVSSFRSDHLWVNICFSYTSLTTQCRGQFHSVAMGLQCSTTPIVTNVGMCFLQLLLLLLMCQLLLLLLMCQLLLLLLLLMCL